MAPPTNSEYGERNSVNEKNKQKNAMSPPNQLSNIQTSYREYAQRIGVPPAKIQLNETPTDKGAAHIEYDGSELCYVVTERGRELERRRTLKPDLLLYWLISDLTHALASSHAAKFRRQPEDFRRMLFVKQLELLGAIKEEWRERRAEEIAVVLATNPYRDSKFPESKPGAR
jgi:Immunity protein 63